MGTGDRPYAPPRGLSANELRKADPKFNLALERFLRHRDVAPLLVKKSIGPAIRNIAESCFAGGWQEALTAEWERRVETKMNEPSDYEGLGLVGNKMHMDGSLEPFLLEPGSVPLYFEPDAQIQPPQAGAPVFLDGKAVGVVTQVIETSPGEWDIKVGEQPSNVHAGPGLRPVNVFSGEPGGA